MAMRIPGSKAQSAMEYLSTYGWMLLILIVVVAVLISLGIFNPGNLAGKAQPGSCQVERPYGPSTTTGIGLTGLCSGEIPQYVAEFSTTAAANIVISSNVIVGPTTALTTSFWVNTPFPSPVTEYLTVLGGNSPSSQQSWAVYLISSSTFINCGWITGVLCQAQFLSASPRANTWTNVMAVLNTNGLILVYIDGVEYSQTVTPGGTPAETFPITIGGPAAGYGIVGQLANVQLYNTALSSNAVTALYSSGIGGAPVDLPNLVGWWPLNGNAYDYSGNGRNGVANGVTYTSSWASGYSAP